MAQNAFISVRVSWEMKTALRAAAAERGWSESQLVQFLLETALGESPETAARDAIVRGVQAQLRERLGLVTAGVKALLEEHIMGPFVGEAGEPFSPDVSPEPDELEPPEDVPPRGVESVRRRGRR